MFPSRKSLFRFLAPAGEGADLPGDGGTEDYGDDFTPANNGAGDAPGGDGERNGDDDSKAFDAMDDAANTEGDGANEGEADESLREAANPDSDSDDKGAKGTGTPKVGKGKFIPLDRHEKLLKKERERREALEAQLAASRAGQEVAKTNDVLGKIEDELVGMEKKYNELLAEGDTEGAAKMMTEIRRKNSELNSVANQQREAQIMAQAVEKVRYDEALDRIEEQYPALNPDAEEFDEDVYQDVVDLMQAGQRRGLSPTKALQHAVARVMGAETAAQKRVTTVQPRVDESQVAEQRRQEAVSRNLETARKQPPATHKAGQGNDSAGGALTAQRVMTMSEDEFAQLDEKTLSKLRGDSL